MTMKIRRMRPFLLLPVLTAAFAIGCASAVKDLDPGDRLYRAKCGSCHRLIEAHEHDTETWRFYVDKYGKKMSPDEKETVLGFLSQNR